MTKAERIEMMRKRQAYFSAIAEEYASFADFIKAQDMWLALMGVELTTRVRDKEHHKKVESAA